MQHWKKLLRCSLTCLALILLSFIGLINGTLLLSSQFLSFILNFVQGLPCDIDGEFLPEGAPPPPRDDPPPNDFSPFENRIAFELADLLFRREQMPANNINDLLQLWAAASPPDQDPPFSNKDVMYDTIDDISEGDAPWQHFTVSYNGEIPEGDTTPWKHAAFDIWFRDPRVVLHNQLGQSRFCRGDGLCPKRSAR
jgi:hypothetical protein